MLTANFIKKYNYLNNSHGYFLKKEFYEISLNFSSDVFNGWLRGPRLQRL